MPTSWAYGYSPSRPSGAGRAGSTFGMPGMSGSAAWADLDSGVAVDDVVNVDVRGRSEPFVVVKPPFVTPGVREP